MCVIRMQVVLVDRVAVEGVVVVVVVFIVSGKLTLIYCSSGGAVQNTIRNA